jgi:hypothetical protein
VKSALFVVVTLGADAIEELATSAKIEAEVQIVGGLTGDWGLRIARRWRESIESTSK